MENAVKALEMAFAVMVFVLALSVSVFAFNQAKSTSDELLYRKDETNYYDYQEATGKAAENRIVGLETIIPTLYKYYKEDYTVLFREAKYSEETGKFIGNIRPLTIYTTPSKSEASNGYLLWGKKSGETNTYDILMNKKYMQLINNYNSNLSSKIFSFDYQEETSRHEPWTGSYEETRKNIDSFLEGTVYKNPSNSTNYINYTGFINEHKYDKFVETVGEYSYESEQAEGESSTEDDTGSSISGLVKEKKKRIVIYTLIKNN